MTNRPTLAAFVLTILFPFLTAVPAEAELFDLIIPGEIEYRASNNSIGIGSGRFGWLVAQDDTITLADLQGAVFTGTASEPAITAVQQQFIQPQDWAPILPGEAAGSRFVESIYNPLLLPGEARKMPPGAANDLSLLNLSFMQVSFAFPLTYPGSTFDLEGSLTIRGETVNYSTEVTIGRSIASSSSIITNPQRLSSVPEPGSTAFTAMGLIGLGLMARRRFQRLELG